MREDVKMVCGSKSLVRWVTALGALCALAACDPYGTYCQEYMDCVGGNEKDVEACIVEAEASADDASLWDCDEYFDEYFECLEAEADCDNDVYGPGDNCDQESERLSACM
jgi:hypothetical protein